MRKARDEATARLDGIEERIGELTVDEVNQAEEDLGTAWTSWTPRHSTLRQLLVDRRPAAQQHGQRVDAMASRPSSLAGLGRTHSPGCETDPSQVGTPSGRARGQGSALAPGEAKT